MQRLNAIIAFIEGEFAYIDDYFDLNTMVETKSLFDLGKIVKKIQNLIVLFVNPLRVIYYRFRFIRLMMEIELTIFLDV